MFAFWSWVAGAAAGVPLQGAAARCCCQSAVAGAVAVASFARCCPGCRVSFHFPSSFSGPKVPWWVGMPLSLL